MITDELNTLFRYDEEKYRKDNLTNLDLATEAQLLAFITTNAHVIEKGLSNSKFEPGHAFSIVQLVADSVRLYRGKGYNLKDLSYINALACLREFYDKHKDTEYKEEVSQILTGILEEVISEKSLIGGAEEFLFDTKVNNSEKNFKDLANGRFSVREFSDAPVSKNVILDAIQLATRAPSACNRQPAKIHLIRNKGVISKVLKVQRGVLDYPDPPVLMLVTADDAYYEGAEQRNQGFVDGGLFAMSLLYAIEYKGLAACPLNACFNEEEEKTIRGMLNLPDREKLIMFIEAGHFKENNIVCKSFRYPAEYIVNEIDELHDFELKLLGPLVITAPEAIEQPLVIDRINQEGTNVGIKLSAKLVLRSIRHKVRARTRIKSLKNKLRLRTRVRILLQNQKNKLKDGLIISLTDNTNYGNVLQRFALKQYLKKHGFNFDILRIESFKINDKNQDTHADILRFVDTYLDDIEYDQDKLQGYRNYVVGSDQVWRAGFWDLFQGNWKPYFLEFLKDDSANRISYAASFGMDTLEEADYTLDTISEVKPYLEKFNAISVREIHGVDLVKQITDGLKNDVEFVIDPTMLLTSQDYSQLANKNPVSTTRNKSKLFAYFLRYEEDIKKFTEKIANRDFNNDYDVYFVDKTKENSIEGWLSGFRDAEFVLTDSFHGSVFSILNNKDFIVYIDPIQSTGRIRSLFSELGIDEERILERGKDTDLNIKKMKQIEWEKVNVNLDRLREQSGRWLINSLK